MLKYSLSVKAMERFKFLSLTSPVLGADVGFVNVVVDVAIVIAAPVVVEYQP